MKSPLKVSFVTLLQKYSSDHLLIEKTWNTMVSHYTSEARHYHTLEHLEAMFELINDYEHLLQHKDAVLFAVWFHDSIYCTIDRNNEEQSAAYAKNILNQLAVPSAIVTKVTEMILLTKKHQISDDSDWDIKLFLDADLAILGSNPEKYQAYAKNVRKEFSQYPDVIYNVGRKKVLDHFLASPSIYKTDSVRNKLEEQAKQNILSELNQLVL